MSPLPQRLRGARCNQNYANTMQIPERRDANPRHNIGGNWSGVLAYLSLAAPPWGLFFSRDRKAAGAHRSGSLCRAARILRHRADTAGRGKNGLSNRNSRSTPSDWLVKASVCARRYFRRIKKTWNRGAWTTVFGRLSARLSREIVLRVRPLSILARIP